MHQLFGQIDLYFRYIRMILSRLAWKPIGAKRLIPNITLEQWAAFKAIVEAGSFARAAELLNKSQSTVSYCISRLEARLPAPLFEQSSRRAVLTPLGKSLCPQVDELLAQAHRIDQVAAALASGWETEVVLAVDGIACMNTVLKALDQFASTTPQTRIRILETTLSGTDKALLTKTADLVITPRIPPGFRGEYFGQVSKIPVVAQNHPLATLTEPISEAQLKQHRQIVVRDSGHKREQDAGWLSATQRWTVTHFSTSIQAITAGYGFGFIPAEMVAKALTSGTLKQLTLNFGGHTPIPLYIVPGAQEALGKASAAVMSALLAHPLE